MSDETQGGPPKPPENEPTIPTPPEPPETPTGEGSPPAGPPSGQPPSGPPPQEPARQAESASDSERSAAMWAHVGGAIITILCVCAPLAFVPPLILFLTNKDKSRFASFHALQALFLFGATSAINLVLGMAGLIGLFFVTIPIATIINLGAGVYAVVIGMQANKGEWAEYVMIGELAKGQLKS